MGLVWAAIAVIYCQILARDRAVSVLEATDQVERLFSCGLDSTLPPDKPSNSTGSSPATQLVKGCALSCEGLCPATQLITDIYRPARSGFASECVCDLETSTVHAAQVGQYGPVQPQEYSNVSKPQEERRSTCSVASSALTARSLTRI